MGDRYHCARAYLPLTLLIALLAVAGCASVERAVVTESAEPPPAAPIPQRPIPWAITPPPSYLEAVSNGTRTPSGRPGPDYWIQDASYTLRARVIPAANRLEGSGRIVYTNNSPDVLEVLHLELAQNIHKEGAIRHEFVPVTGGVDLSYVAVNDEELFVADLAAEGAPSYEVTGTDLALFPENPVAPDESVTIELEWAFDVPQQGAGARMGHQGENLLFLAYWYPIMSVYDDVEGWQTEQFSGTAEFYSDFGDYDVTIEIPEGWIVWATGRLQNAEDVLAPEVVERMRRAHQSDEPMRVVDPGDFGPAATRTGTDGLLRWRFTADDVRDVAFSATSEAIWDAARTPVGDRDGDGSTDYAAINTFYRETAPLWAEVTEYQQHAISFHSENTGYPYPWPHMTAVEGGGIIGGGMEFPMMTLMGDYNARGDSALYYVTAHELAHMWVPMIVNVNERRFSWIDEGFTTFNENEARMDYFPGENHYLPDQRLYAAVAQQGQEGELMRPSAYHSTSLAFGIASYMKPATLLAALKGVLGEETFYRAYRTFIDEWAFKHPYPWDLFNTFERVAERDLDWYWRSWYYETWTLDQAISEVRVDDGRTTIVIEDEGLAPMPVLLEIELENGETIERSIPVDAWLRGDTTASVTVETDSPVVRVSIDPENLFPDVDLSDNDWRRGQDPSSVGSR